MAKITSIERFGEVVLYGGAFYGKISGPARLGDLLLSNTDEYADVDIEDFFQVTLIHDGIFGFEDNGEDARGIDDRKDAYGLGVSSGDFDVFRKDALTAEMMRQLLEKKQAEVTEIQRLIDEQGTIKVGDFVVLSALSYNSKLDAGAVGLVERVDRLDEEVPYRVRTLFGVKDWVVSDAVRKITSHEAHQLFLAKVDEFTSI